MRRFTPMNDQVLVCRREAETISRGGIHIPDRDQEQQLEGEVLSVGPGRMHPALMERIPMGVQVGDVVLFKKYAGTDIKIDGETVVVLEESEILGKLTEA